MPDLTNIRSGWSNLDPRGLEATPGTRGKLVFGIAAGTQDAIDYVIADDGTVTCSEGYEAVVEDGWITEFRPVVHA